MKKIISILICVTCISVIAIAQSGVRIGNLEFIVRKTENDTVAQINVNDPCPPCPPESETKPRANLYRQRISDGFWGIGFILPNNGSDYYSVLGVNSFNIDLGGEHRYHLSRRFALGGTTQYSFYNYRMMAKEPAYLEEVIGKTVAKNDVRKQVYRSHNIATGIFTRFYLVPPQGNRVKGGMYIDIGVQGDFAFSKYCKLKTYSKGKEKYRDPHAFNPFSASATARLGWKSQKIFVRYRFTDAFNSTVLPMDISPITIGLQFF